MSPATLWLLVTNLAGTALGQTICTNGDVQLVGGTTPLNGRVEVCYNNQWGRVCSPSRYHWGQEEATAVCRQLGYPYEAIAYSSGYGYATPITFLNVDRCDIRADQLLSCYSYINGYTPATLGYYNCTGYNNFVVNCTIPTPEYCSGTCTNGTIRLVGGPSPYKGRVEVCVGGCWGTVCGNEFNVPDAVVVCRELGYPTLGATPLYYGGGSGPIWLYGLNCAGNEPSLFDCLLYSDSYDYNYYGSEHSYNYCDHSGDAGVFCPEKSSSCFNGDIRLVNGSTPMEGRVEVCIGGQWGTVCGDMYWTSDTSGANTVCKQLGYSPSNATAYGSSYFGSGTGGIFMVNVHCDARAGRLVDCNYYYQHYFSYCWNGYTAGVHCQGSSVSVCTNGSVRLVGGPTPYEGTVEVCAYGSWGTVCSNYWDMLDASVVCRQLGYKAVGVFMYSNNYGRATGPVWLQNLNCTGNELQLFNCPVVNIPNTYYYCGHSNDAAVQCAATVQNCTDWDIRLVDGSSPSQGRVEVCYMNQWGTICSGGQTVIPAYANVICRQLGYSFFNPTVYPNSYFGRGSGGIYLYTPTLLCTGNESRLQDCYHSTLGYHQCNGHYWDIGVVCQANTAGTTHCVSGTLQLVGGSVPSEGRVEICLGGKWSTICGYPSPWDQSNAVVICQHLGFKSSSDAGTVYSGIFGQGSGLALQIPAGCVGNEASLLQCPPQDYNYYYYGYHYYYGYNYYTGLYYTTCSDHVYDIGVRCTPAFSAGQCQDGDVRLANGTTGPDTIEGRVEICYGGQWGVVYAAVGTPWTLREASVVCRQLQYAPVALEAFTYSKYGVGTGNVSFSEFYCIGYESKLIDCICNPPGYYEDYWYYAVGVRCQVSCHQCQNGSIQLVGGNSSYEGRIEVCEGGCWGPVCIGDSGWSSLDAAVACRQLNMTSQGAVPRYYYSVPLPPILAPHCTGSESSLFSCAQSVCHEENYNHAGVECSPVTQSSSSEYTTSAVSSTPSTSLIPTTIPAATSDQATTIITAFSAALVAVFLILTAMMVLAVMTTVLIMRHKHSQIYTCSIRKPECNIASSDIMELKESNFVNETTMQDDDHYEPVNVEGNKNTDGEHKVN